MISNSTPVTAQGAKTQLLNTAWDSQIKNCEISSTVKQENVWDKLTEFVKEEQLTWSD